MRYLLKQKINRVACIFLIRVPVPPRNKSQALKAFGLYPNTEVMRGPHWKWKNDDGNAIL